MATTVRELITRWAFKADTGKVSRFNAAVGRVKRGAAIASKGLGVMSVAALGAAAGIFKLTTNVANNLDKIDKMSKRTNLSTEFLQEMAHAADLSAVNLEALPMGMKTLMQVSYDASRGLKTAKENFDELGVSVTEANGKMKPTEKLVKEVMMALADTTNESKRMALASKLLGRSGQDMQTMLEGGGTALADMWGEAHDYSMIIGKDGVAAAASFNDEMVRMKSQVTTMVTEFASGLLPTFKSGVSVLKDWIKNNREMLSQKIHEVVTKLAAAFKKFMESAAKHDLIGKLTSFFEKLLSVITFVIENFETMVKVFVVLMGINLIGKLSPLIGMFGGLATAAGGMTAAVGATTLGVKALLAQFALVVGVGAAAYAATSWLDKKFGWSDKLSDIAVKGQREESVKRVLAHKKEVNTQALKDQMAQYQKLAASGATSFESAPGVKRELTKENVQTKLEEMAFKLGLSGEQVSKTIPQMMKNSNIQSTVTVNVAGNATASDAKKIADEVTNANRRALADVGK